MKDIQGFEGRYSIIEDGKIWSYPNRRNRFKGMWLRPFRQVHTDRRKTPRVILCVSLFDASGNRFVRQVHRLVASAFIPNPMSLPVVNHIDGNTLNPIVSNLEWVTNKENSDHAFQKGLITKPLTSGEVSEIRKICKFVSCRKVALAYRMRPSSLWRIIKGHRYAEVV